MTESEQQEVIQQVDHWLYNVVIGLNLCPFALKPYKNQQILTVVSDCTDEACLLQQMRDEFEKMLLTDISELETTLLVTPNMLGDFYDYNQFLDYAEALIEQNNWTGIFQIASFHPDYQFAGTQSEDAENLTNRSPYPILHLLREKSLEKAIDRFPNTELIPETNIDTVENLDQQQRQKLFNFLYKK